jgi:hypothetical protein
MERLRFDGYLTQRTTAPNGAVARRLQSSRSVTSNEAFSGRRTTARV